MCLTSPEYAFDKKTYQYSPETGKALFPLKSYYTHFCNRPLTPENEKKFMEEECIKNFIDPKDFQRDEEGNYRFSRLEDKKGRADKNGHYFAEYSFCVYSQLHGMAVNQLI